MSDWLDFALPLVIYFEGCEKRRGGMVYPYLDRLASPPVWTRGYGRTYGICEDSPGITGEEAKKELREGLVSYSCAMLKLAAPIATKPQSHAAVVSWCWNCGIGAFRVSRLRRAINEGNWEKAAVLIARPRTAGGVELKGLVRRRDAEAALFIKGIQ